MKYDLGGLNCLHFPPKVSFLYYQVRPMTHDLDFTNKTVIDRMTWKRWPNRIPATHLNVVADLHIYILDTRPAFGLIFGDS